MDVTKRINGYNFEFKETCSACPEQYDVYLEGKQVGYVRLRWGGLRCDYPDVGGDTIYTHNFEDGLLGAFTNNNVRNYHLEKIAESLYNRISQTENLNEKGISQSTVRLGCSKESDRACVCNGVPCGPIRSRTRGRVST